MDKETKQALRDLKEAREAIKTATPETMFIYKEKEKCAEREILLLLNLQNYAWYGINFCDCGKKQ
jgi:hypothetical protein